MTQVCLGSVDISASRQDHFVLLCVSHNCQLSNAVAGLMNNEGMYSITGNVFYCSDQLPATSVLDSPDVNKKSPTTKSR